MAKIVTEAGAAAILVDSFAPRRIGRAAALGTVCTGVRLQGRQRAGDLFAVMAWARALMRAASVNTWRCCERARCVVVRCANT